MMWQAKHDANKCVVDLWCTHMWVWWWHLPTPFRHSNQIKWPLIYNALIDIGASYNLVYFDNWNQLGIPATLNQPNIKVKDMNA